MCGIAGIIALNRNYILPDGNSSILSSLHHRGPDANGSYKNGRVQLYHTRLSIIDVSSHANQPFFDQSGKFVVVFNGEIYNYQSIRNQLNRNWKTNSDTEVLVEAFAEWGVNCISKLDGMFAFAVYDVEKNTTYVVRDRMGVKPLYYYSDEQSLMFSSEIRTLIKSCQTPVKLNFNGIYNFLKYQSCITPETIIEGLTQLEAGHYLKVENGRIEKYKYYDLLTSIQPVEESSLQDIHKKVKDLLIKSVEKRMISDVPLGAFLSGGIDSAAIVALMSETSGKPVDTFTVSVNDNELDERENAEVIAKKYKTNHTVVELSSDSMVEFVLPGLNSMDSPTGDGINTFIVSQAVKQKGLSVALSGIGGDELFAGYPFFKRYHYLSKVSGVWNNSRGVRHMMAGVVKSTKAKQLLQIDSLSNESVFPLFRQVFSDESIQNIFLEKQQFTDNYANFLNVNSTTLNRFDPITKVSLTELLGYTQNTLLKDTDQMSMAHSLEVREPFFDKDLVEYVLGVPGKQKFPNKPKQLLVDSLKGMIPDQIIFQKKRGFTFPWANWMRNELKTFCEKQVSNFAERSFVNDHYVITLWKRFEQKDPSVQWMQIWLIVVLEYWLTQNNIECDETLVDIYSDRSLHIV